MPERVREQLAAEYRQVEAMCDKLARGDLHIAAFGRVGVGKSSLLNAMLGEARFEVGVVHGVTREATMQRWRATESGAGVYVFDTPGLDEISGEDRERLAHEVAGRVDLVLFVVEADLTETELVALRSLSAERRPVLVVLNKADRYTETERQRLLATLRQRVARLVAPDNVLAAAAAPAPRTVIEQSADGGERETERPREPSLQSLVERIWAVLEREGRSLAAVNAGLFAARLSDQVAERVAAARRDIAERVVRTYCVGKAVAVALNPLPAADLLGAAAVDAGMVVHLGRVYGLPLSRTEAGRVLATIAAQLAALMGSVWVVQLASSTLKGLSLGLTVGLTAAAQGATAYYATYLVGRAAEQYLVRGKSWGELGPRRVVADIIDSVDRDSILADARAEMKWRLRRS